jgi:hypothetical protein
LAGVGSHPPPGRDRAEDEEMSEEKLDSKPTPEFLSILGAINLFWASMEVYAAAALFSLLEINESDFTILVGRSDIVPKFEKIKLILEHRKDPRLQRAKEFVSELKRLRPDRNAITHGHYQGETTRGEYIFFLMADAMIDDEEGGVRKMRIFTEKELADHCSKTVNLLLNEIKRLFDNAKMRELFLGSFMVPKEFRG